MYKVIDIFSGKVVCECADKRGILTGRNDMDAGRPSLFVKRSWEVRFNTATGKNEPCRSTEMDFSELNVSGRDIKPCARWAYRWNGVRFAKADSAMRKPTFRHLDGDQKKYVKLVLRHRQAEKELDRFYRTCRRTETGAVDFQSMSESELDWFELANKEREKTRAAMSRMEEKIDGDLALRLFNQFNTHSA